MRRISDLTLAEETLIRKYIELVEYKLWWIKGGDIESNYGGKLKDLLMDVDRIRSESEELIERLLK